MMTELSLLGDQSI